MLVETELMQIVQMVSQVATALGVCAAAIYYIMTLRNTERIRKRDMVFQKLNVNMKQHYEIIYDVVKMVDWDTLEEFYRKYNNYTNPEAIPKIMYVMNHYNALGMLLKDKIVEPEQVFKLYSGRQIMQILDQLKPWTDYMHMPEDPTFQGIKYLYDESRKLYPTWVISRFPRSAEEFMDRFKK